MSSTSTQESIHQTLSSMVSDIPTHKTTAQLTAITHVELIVILMGADYMAPGFYSPTG